MKSIRHISILMGWITTLGLIATVLSNDAGALETLDCTGITKEMLGGVQSSIDKIEKKVNSPIDKYVRMLDFSNNSDDNKWGISGTANIGHISAPKFDLQKPAKDSWSAAPDYSMRPSYDIDAILFGHKVSVLDISFEGGQGPKTFKDGAEETGDSARGVSMEIKVFGINILDANARGPEVVAAQLSKITGEFVPGLTVGTEADHDNFKPPPSLKPQETTGKKERLLDIKKAISDMAGGQEMTRLGPYFNVIYINWDIGFIITLDLIFTYEVNSMFFNYSGAKALVPGQNRQDKTDNPATNTEAFCDAPVDGGNCQTNDTQTSEHDDEFIEALAQASPVGQQISEDAKLYNKWRDLVRTGRIQDMLATSKAIKAFAQNELDYLAELETDTEKDEFIQTIDFKSKLRGPTVEGSGGGSGGGDQASAIMEVAGTALETYDAITRTVTMVKQIGSAFEDGVPEVTAGVGLKLSGQISVWAEITVEATLELLKVYVGVNGTLSLIELTGGFGISASTKSQYLNLTVDLSAITLRGEMFLVVGASLGLDDTPFCLQYRGQFRLLSGDGYIYKEKFLAARLDVRTPAGQKNLFWCTTAFGGKITDPQRCADGAVSTNELGPELATFEKFKLEVLGENIVKETDSCFVSADGDVIFSSMDDVNTCNQVRMPTSETAPMENLPDGKPHPIVAKSKVDAQFLLTFLRDAQGYPIKYFSSIAKDTPRQDRFYKSVQPVPANTVEGNLIGKLIKPPSDFQPPSATSINDPMNKRIFTLSSAAVHEELEDGTNQKVTVDQRTNPLYQIEMTPGPGGRYPNKTYVAVHDLLSLPNDELTYLASKNRLGACTLKKYTTNTGVVRDILRANSMAYPRKGDRTGIVALNMTDPKLGCTLESTATDTPENIQMWAACQLRIALISEKCFPPKRLKEYVAFGKLSSVEILNYFLRDSPKRISGTLESGDQRPDNTGQNTKIISHLYYGNQQTLNPGVPGLVHTFNSANQYDSPYGFVPDPHENGGFVFDDLPGNSNQVCNTWHVNATLAMIPDYNTHFTREFVFPWENADTPYLVGSEIDWQEHNYYQAQGLPVVDLVSYYHTHGYPYFTQIDASGAMAYGTKISPRDAHWYSTNIMCRWGAPTLTAPYAKTCPAVQNFFSRPLYAPMFVKGPTVSGTPAFMTAEILDPNTYARYNNPSIDRNDQLCVDTHPQHLKNFANTKRSELLSGLTDSELTAAAIRDCVYADNGCVYTPQFQETEEPSTCVAYVTGSNYDNFWFRIPGPKNTVGIEHCIKNHPNLPSTNTGFCENEDLKSRFEAALAAQNPAAANSSTVYYHNYLVGAKWQKITNQGISDLEKIKNAERILARCIFTTQYGVIKFMAGATTSAPVVTPTPSASACTLKITPSSFTDPNADQEVPDGQGQTAPISNSAPITIQNISAESMNSIHSMTDCKRSLGFDNSVSVSSALRLLKNLTRGFNACKLSPSQAVDLRKRFPMAAGQTSQDLFVYATYTNNGTSTSLPVGNCSLSAEEIGTSINQAQCYLRVRNNVQGTTYEAKIPVTVPQNSSNSLAYETRGQFCRDLVHSLYPITTTPFNSNRYCSNNLKKLPEFLAVGGVLGVNYNSGPDLYGHQTVELMATLGETDLDQQGETCSGRFFKVGEPGNNQSCKIKGSMRLAGPSGAINTNNPYIFLSLTPVNRQYANWEEVPSGTDPTLIALNQQNCNSGWKNMVQGAGPNLCLQYAKDVKVSLSAYPGPIINPAITFNGNAEQTWSSLPQAGLIATLNLTSLHHNITWTDQHPGQELKFCNYEFKEVPGVFGNPTVWDLKPSDWTPTVLTSAPIAAPSTIGPAKIQGEDNCLYSEDSNGCIQVNNGERVILGGADARVLEVIPATNSSLVIDEAYLANVCQTKLTSMSPVSDLKQSDDTKRLPMWVRTGSSTTSFVKPDDLAPANYYCQIPKCELLVEYGNKSNLTTAGWRAKLGLLPTNASDCKAYYREQVNSYCDLRMTSAEMPDNLEVELTSVFGESRTKVGTCPALTTGLRQCAIGIRPIESFMSWIAGTHFFASAILNLFEEFNILPTFSSKTALMHPKANDLESCIEAGNDLNEGKAVCNMPTLQNSSSIDRTHPYQVSVKFGNLWANIDTCNGPISGSGPVVISTSGPVESPEQGSSSGGGGAAESPTLVVPQDGSEPTAEPTIAPQDSTRDGGSNDNGEAKNGDAALTPNFVLKDDRCDTNLYLLNPSDGQLQFRVCNGTDTDQTSCFEQDSNLDLNIANIEGTENSISYQSLVDRLPDFSDPGNTKLIVRQVNSAGIQSPWNTVSPELIVQLREKSKKCQGDQNQ